MFEHLFCVVATDQRTVPARVCGLLAQRNIEVSSLQMARVPGSDRWWIQLVVRLETHNEIELVIKRLNRLVDVVKTIDVGEAASHQRQSLFVRLRPAPTELIHVSEIATLFRAEVLEVTDTTTTLYLSAEPDRCENFVAVLDPYCVVEVVRGAVLGLRREHPAAARMHSLSPPTPSRLTAVPK